MSMNIKSLLRPTAPLAALAVGACLLVGCQNDDKSPTEISETVDVGLNAGKMGAFPAVTRERILVDLDGKVIQSAEILTTATGPLYEVVYIEEGQPKRKVYNREGLAQALPGDRPTDRTSPPIEQEGTQGGARDVGSQTPTRQPPAGNNAGPNDPTSGGLPRPVGGGGDIPD